MARRGSLRSQQRIGYAALFAASSASLVKLATNPRHIGSRRLGFFGVLHTWGRSLEFHPHIHYIVPGGGLSADGSRWLPSALGFFLPARALSVLFRAEFRDELAHAGLRGQIDPAVWRQDWVVHSQAADDGRKSLQYLAPYVFRVALHDRRIVFCDDGPDGRGRVTFSYRPSGTHRYRTITLDADEFRRRFPRRRSTNGHPRIARARGGSRSLSIRHVTAHVCAS